LGPAKSGHLTEVPDKSEI